MADKLKNIIEDIALGFLNNALAIRYDICTCAKCRNDMMAYILSHVPAKYVTSERGALYTIIDQTRLEKEAEIARAVIAAIGVVSKSPHHEVKDDKKQAFELLLTKIFEDRGLDFRHYHHDILKRRVAIRMNANKISNFSDYLMLLIKNPQEYDKLFEVLCINVTEFFRDPDVWDMLKILIKELLEKKCAQNDRTLTIWSAACATGEEPYSIAIMLREHFKNELKDFPITIYATDIDPKALRAAEKAVYQKRLLRNLKNEQLKLYFTPAGNDEWKISPEIKNLITFKSLDLISSGYIKNTDIVFCRNVFIYFTRSLQDQLLMKFYHSLKNNGIFVMGKTETMWPEAKEIFEEIDLKTHIYRKHQVDDPATNR